MGGWGGDLVRAQRSAHILGPSCPQANSQVPLKAVLFRMLLQGALAHKDAGTGTCGQTHVDQQGHRPALPAAFAPEPQPTGQALGRTPTAGFQDLVGKQRYKTS